MKRFILIAVLFLTAQIATSQSPDMVLEICRHGARGPTRNTYDPSWTDDQLGVLTPQGMRQHYILGKALQETYPDLLNQPFNKTLIYTIADTSNRTIRSAISQYYGIQLGHGPGLGDNYPPELAVPAFNSPYINDTLKNLTDSAALPFNHYPMIIDYVTQDEGYLFGADDPSVCKKMQTWYVANYFDLPSWNAWAKFKPMINFLDNYVKLKDPLAFTEFSDVIFVDLMANKTLPYGIPYDQDLLTNISFARTFFLFHFWGGQKKQVEVAAYGLLERVQRFLTDNVATKFALFSGHDSNVYAFLRALNVLTEDCAMENFEYYWEHGKEIINPICHYPIFASQITIEVYRTSSPYIKMYYENDVVKICNHEETCPLETFKNLLSEAQGQIKSLTDFHNACDSIIVQEEEENYTFVTEEAIFMKVSKSFDEFSYEDWAIAGLGMLAIGLLFLIVRNQKRHQMEIRDIRQQKAI